ncbi:MAG: hypothetical protein KF847_14560 [Pirellulales bacterium]|nr:hypothetical protein [Pirellulales bacterium]
MPWMVPVCRRLLAPSLEPQARASGLRRSAVRALSLAASLVALAAAPLAAAPNPSTAPARQVGDAGDLRRVELVGVRQCDPLEVRRALLLDLELQAAARPSADMAAFLDALQTRLRAGYCQSGFPDAVVDVSYDSVTDSVSAYIHEGQHFRLRSLRVVGGTAKVRTALVKSLTTVPPPRSWSLSVAGKPTATPHDQSPGRPAFVRGEPASLDVAGLRRVVENRLTTLGYPAATIEVAVILDRGRARVDWEVDVQRLGPQAVAAEIVLAGLERNTREQALALIAAEVGDRVTGESLAAIHERLRQSCRFWTYEVAARVPKLTPAQKRGETAPVELAIELVEYPHVAPLGAPLAPADAALARCAGWLESQLADPAADDLLCQFKATARKGAAAQSFTAAVRPGGGWLVDANSSLLSGVQLHHAALVAGGELLVCNWSRSERIEHPLPGRPTLQLQFVPGPVAGGEFKSALKLVPGFRAAGAGDSAASAGEFTAQIEPVALVHLAHRAGSRVACRDDQAVVAVGGMELTVEAATGRLRHVRSTLPGASVLFGFVPGAFAKEQARIQAQAARLGQRYSAQRPASSWARFLADQIAEQPLAAADPVASLVCRQARHLAEQGWFDAQLAQWAPRLAGKTPLGAPRHAFRLASPLADRPRLQAETDPCGATAVMFGPAIADAMFPRGSWPWTLMREASFAAAHERGLISSVRGANRELKRIARARDTGPVGLFAATLFAASTKTMIDPTQFVDAAVRRLSDDSLATDVRLAVYGEYGFAAATRATFESFAALETRERQKLAAELPAPWGAVLEVVAQRIEQSPQRPIGQTIETALVEAWDDGLRDLAEAKLRALVDPVETRQAREQNEGKLIK